MLITLLSMTSFTTYISGVNPTTICFPFLILKVRQPWEVWPVMRFRLLFLESVKSSIWEFQCRVPPLMNCARSKFAAHCWAVRGLDVRLCVIATIVINNAATWVSFSRLQSRMRTTPSSGSPYSRSTLFESFWGVEIINDEEARFIFDFQLSKWVNKFEKVNDALHASKSWTRFFC